jgi:hypothetical protein
MDPQSATCGSPTDKCVLVGEFFKNYIFKKTKPEKGQNAVVVLADIFTAVARFVDILGNFAPLFTMHLNTLEEAQDFLIGPVEVVFLSVFIRIDAVQIRLQAVLQTRISAWFASTKKW